MLKNFLHKYLQIITLTALFAAMPTVICAQEPHETAQNTPEAAQNTPEAAQNTPEAAQNTPEAAQNTPETAQNTPETAQNTPEAAQNTPEAAQITPETAQNTPEAAQNTPEAAQITPEAAQITAQPTSNLEAALPSAVPTPPAAKTDSQCYESFTYANALLRAENAYVRRKYTTVIEILKPIFENLQCIDDSNAIIEIELLLGVSYLEQNNAALADTFFLNVLRSDPDHVVGSVITLPESSARYIEDLRTQHAEELDQLRSERSPNTIIESLYIVTEKEQHPYWINFLPFGAGVFQMHETAWGAIYASLQLTGITLSILGGGMVEYYRGENFTYTPQNAVYAHNWQTAQIIGISMLAAGYIASVIHALIIHEDSTMIIHSPTQTRPDIAHNAGPFILPDGGGIAYSTKF